VRCRGTPTGDALAEGHYFLHVTWESHEGASAWQDTNKVLRAALLNDPFAARSLVAAATYFHEQRVVCCRSQLTEACCCSPVFANSCLLLLQAMPGEAKRLFTFDKVDDRQQFVFDSQRDGIFPLFATLLKKLQVSQTNFPPILQDLNGVGKKLNERSQEWVKKPISSSSLPPMLRTAGWFHHLDENLLPGVQHLNDLFNMACLHRLAFLLYALDTKFARLIHRPVLDFAIEGARCIRPMHLTRFASHPAGPCFGWWLAER
jgi:hypothetical protein